jgi:ATP-dependent helicase/DNAse subunit B
MPELILHTGPQGRYYYFIDQINKLLPEQSNSFLYLLPVNRAVRYLIKKLVSNTTGSILIEPYIFTFNSLTRHIYQYLPRPRKVIPREMRLVLINRILEEQGMALSYFKYPVPALNGFINRIDQMLDEFCEFGYRPGDFSQPPPTCHDKYKDFGQILSFLHGKYKDQLLDERGVITEVVQALDYNLFNQIFPAVKYIYINGYGIYTPPMIDFIRKVKDWCRVEIKLEYNGQNQELFAHTRPAFEVLQEISARVIREESDHDLLGKHFFKIHSTLKPTLPGTRFTWQVLKNKELEVAFIAATIKKLHQDTGLPLNQFGITFPNLENYAPLIRNVFKDAGLAYNLSTGFSLAQSPLIQSYLQVLKVVTQGFDCGQIYLLLLSPLLRGDDRLAATWKRLSERMRMKYLRSDWRQQVHAFLQLRREQQVVNGEEIDVTFIALVEKLMARLPAVIQSLQSFPDRAPAVKLQEHYVRVLSELGMLKWMEQKQEYLNRPEQERIYRALNRFIKLLEQLTWILQFQEQDRPIALADYYRYLSLLVQQTTYNLREWSNYGVQIMPRLEIQSQECDYLFIGGLVEGNFPRHFRRDIFFNDQERQQMGLTASEDVLAQDRFLLYQLLSSNAQQIYLTCPKFSGDIELLPSTFLASLRDTGQLNETDQTVSETFILTGSSFSEYLSSRIKSGLDFQHLRWFKDWLSINSIPAAEHWLAGVETGYKKLNRNTRNRYEGNLEENPVVAQNLRQAFGAKPFSITALESYAFCPMQYFLNRILKLEEEEELEAGITAMEKGLLVHRILFRFYSELTIKNAAANPRDHYNLLVRIAGEEFDKLPYSGLLWSLEKEVYFGRAGVPGLWEKFIDLETAEIADSGFQPAHFEVAFGRAGSGRYQDPFSSPQPILIQGHGKKVKLIGKIDRVDIHQRKHLLVFDYKISSTVSNIKIDDLYRGYSLQLPVYLYAIGQLLPQGSPAAAGYYQVRDADHCQRYIVFADTSRQPDLLGKKKVKTVLPLKIEGQEITLRNLIDRSLNFVIEYTDNINRGKFYHTSRPEDERCRSYCPYNKICRKDVAKLKSMAAGEKN